MLNIGLVLRQNRAKILQQRFYAQETNAASPIWWSTPDEFQLVPWLMTDVRVNYGACELIPKRFTGSHSQSGYVLRLDGIQTSNLYAVKVLTATNPH